MQHHRLIGTELWQAARVGVVMGAVGLGGLHDATIIVERNGHEVGRVRPAGDRCVERARRGAQIPAVMST